MTIVLDHTIVPARDKEESARFFAHIFGLEYKGPVSHFAPVRINDTLTIDFDNWDSFERHHYAFKVSEAEFDGIFDRVRGERLAYGSGPRSAENRGIPESAAKHSSAPQHTPPRVRVNFNLYPFVVLNPSLLRGLRTYASRVASKVPFWLASRPARI